ncbi:Metal-dependent hydrolase, endonuclease/exonuclease/phosphatase family [Halogranum rubrum]|uniref:Metal-dependent hydrolase, endonuclease/exonuclease/phosphatase family n=1 Tax=Halogranum rubrum TaxID=553466 RepID=A0A1I4E0E5_9EURY|nr:Metal-dependent hydrolase, endonuclease/exonuclease/phosphatase family [Halogranum rubrum]
MRVRLVKQQTFSRRSVLRGIAGGVVAAPSLGRTNGNWNEVGDRDKRTDTETMAKQSESTAEPPLVTVMTRNLYVGVDPRRLLLQSAEEEMGTVVADLLADIERSRFDARAEAIADDIAEARPDLVGLQEVTLLRLQLPGDYVSDAGRTNASEYYLDFLGLVQSALAERGLTYGVVSSVTNTDVELPADLDAGLADVRLTDRDVVLARQGLVTHNPRRHTYDATVTIPFPDGVEFPLVRGYCGIDVEVDDTEFTFVNTHLDSTSASTQLDQARELVVDLTALDRPVVLVGDFNSPADGSETVTYDLLTQFFVDAYAEREPDSAGYTCCQHPTLRRTRSMLSKRLDLVLLRDVGPVVDVDRVGLHSADRVSTTVDGETRRLWASDHAGVVATVRVDPSGTVPRPSGRERTLSSSRTSTARYSNESANETGANGVNRTESTGGETTDVAVPGFGFLAAAIALAAIAVEAVRRRNAE